MHLRRSTTLLAPLTDRRARPLLLSFWAAELSDGMISVIVPIAVYLITQDVGAIALVFLARLVCAILLASLGGHLADRLQRKYLLLANYGVRLICAVLILVWQHEPLVFALVGTGLGALGAFDNPAAEASIRSVFRHDLQAIAAMRKVAKTLSAMIGPAVGGLLIGTTGPRGALWVSICLITVALVLLVPVPALPTRTHDEAAARASHTPSTRAQGAIQQPVRGTRPRLLVTILVAGGGTSFLVGLVIAAGVPHLAEHPEAPEGAYGFALAVYSVGAILGAWAAGLVGWRDEHLRSVLVASAFGYGVIAAGGMAGPWWTILVSWFVWGICFGPDDILTDRYLVARTPDYRLARLYAFWSNVHRLGAMAAYLTMYAVGQQDPTRLTLFISLGFAVVAPLLIAILAQRSEGRPGQIA